MCQIEEIKVSTILRPTGIDLAPYVINPYQGCSLGCLFCYAQFSKTAQKEERPWGSYVKVKINASEMLQKELEKIKPEKVLLGSTTEIFQPLEKKYKVTESILKILNAQKIPYVLMSRSPLICDYVRLLQEGSCERIYFTVNAFPPELGIRIKEAAPAAAQSIETIKVLEKNDIPVVAYLCPLLPGQDNWKALFKSLQGVKNIECEIMNFLMAKNNDLWGKLMQADSGQADFYRQFLEDEVFYKQVMQEFSDDIRAEAISLGKNIKIHQHEFCAYFNNRYQ